MPFNLIMKRKVLATIQVMCDQYEDKYKEKVATAKVVNVLLAEALISRDLIPADFIKEYGSEDPIKDGFTPKARVPVIKHVDYEIEKMSKRFSGVVDQ